MITKGKKYLVTGGTGVIGYSLCKRIINMGGYVIVLSRSESKLNKLKEKYNEIEIVVGDICDKQLVRDTIKKVDGVFHLAALAGVRNSFLKPKGYIDTNIIGSFNILEKTKQFNVPHIIIASTSSVYGQKEKFPVKEMDETNKPISIYAATKKSMEVISYVYSHNFNIKVTILRFFKISNIHLVVKVVNVSQDRIEYIDHINNPKINILKLIQMTTAIPLLVKPIKYKDNLYQDGGLSGNCPIEANESKNYLCIEILPNKCKKEINHIFDYLIKGWDMYTPDILIRKYDKRNIKIDLSHLNIILSDFHIDNMTKKSLLKEGYNQTIEHFNRYLQLV